MNIKPEIAIKTKKTKRVRGKRQKWQIGDYFLVPLVNHEEFVIGQIIGHIPRALNSVICIFFDAKVKNVENALDKIKYLTMYDVIAARFVIRSSLDWEQTRMWRVFTSAKPLSIEKFFDVKKLEKTLVGVEIEDPGIIDDFLDAFYGLAPWDVYDEFDYFDTFLFFPDKKPKNLIYKNEENRLAAERKCEQLQNAGIEGQKEQPKLQKWQAGDYFLVPLVNGEFGLGQIVLDMIAKNPSCLVCAYFDLRMKNIEEALAWLPKLSYANVISLQATTKDAIEAVGVKQWQVIVQKKENGLRIAIAIANEDNNVGVVVYGSSIMTYFLNAYHGLVAWDRKLDMVTCDELLLSTDLKSPQLRYKKDFAEEPPLLITAKDPPPDQRCEYHFDKDASVSDKEALDFIQELRIQQAGGIEKEGGPLANKRHQMNTRRFEEIRRKFMKFKLG